jgi:dTDP-4-amino-4,6-dideoxygalactose transaminase
MIGNFGDAEVLSFHATKFFNTFEGGAVVTNDDDLAAKIRLMKNFGFSGYDNVIYIGTNGKMNEVSAAMGLTGLECLDEFIDINHRNYRQYQREFVGIDGIRQVTYDENERCNFQYIVLEIDDSITQITRDQLIRILHAENVLARRYFYPGCHQMEPYRSHFPHAGLLLPETERLVTRVMSLPTGTGIDVDQISAICEIIQYAVSHGREINERLNASSEKVQ